MADSVRHVDHSVYPFHRNCYMEELESWHFLVRTSDRFKQYHQLRFGSKIPAQDRSCEFSQLLLALRNNVKTLDKNR